MKITQKNSAAEADAKTQDNINTMRIELQEAIGGIFILVGVSAADSEAILIPLIIVLLGIMIIRRKRWN